MARGESWTPPIYRPNIPTLYEELEKIFDQRDNLLEQRKFAEATKLLKENEAKISNYYGPPAFYSCLCEINDLKHQVEQNDGKVYV